MTGPLMFNRQMSSTDGVSNVDKNNQQKLRRCSSVDDHRKMEPIPDDRSYKIESTMKDDYSGSDIDSGAEDLETQMVFVATHNDQHYDDDDNESNRFGAVEDEGYDGYQRLQTPILNEIDQLELRNARIQDDINKAATILHEDKKTFCHDTREVFHGEFQRMIGAPIGLLNVGCGYYLFAEEDLPVPMLQNIPFGFAKVDNAKAQFKCVHCNRLWTSMRARIAFSVTAPQQYGCVVLKILGQNCQQCGAPADALWYMEEVCRVMENLANDIYTRYFPSLVGSLDNSQQEHMYSASNQMSRHANHDPKQRKGKMSAAHDRNLCEACRRGLCFPSNV